MFNRRDWVGTVAVGIFCRELMAVVFGTDKTIWRIVERRIRKKEAERDGGGGARRLLRVPSWRNMGSDVALRSLKINITMSLIVPTNKKMPGTLRKAFLVDI